MIKTYLQPPSIEEAVKLKDLFNKDAIYYAGGTEINSTELSNDIIYLISTELLGLDKIDYYKDQTVIGTTVTLQMLLDSDSVPESIKTVSNYVTNRNIRNMATIGGNIAANKSCSVLLPLLIVMDAKLIIFDINGKKTLSIEEFQKDPLDKLITLILIPSVPKRFIDVKHFSRTSNDISILNVAVSLKKEQELITDIKVAVGGVSKHVIRLQKLEEFLIGKTLPEKADLEEMIKCYINPISDLRGSAEFKSYMTSVLVTDCIYNCFNQEVL